MDGIVKQLVRPVPPAQVTRVDLFVGSEHRTLEMSRPTSFDELVLLSRPSQSVRSGDFGGRIGFARRLFSVAGRTIDLDCFFDTRSGGPNNISHLLIDIVPLCLLACQAVPDVKFVFRPMAPHFRELLGFFGIDPLCTDRPVRGRGLEFFLTRQLALFSMGCAFGSPVTTLTGEVYRDYFRKPAGPRKLFISRRGPRSLANEADVLAMLAPEGFQIFYPEDHSIPDQIAAIQAADQVVTIHGAAMAFLALKERTEKIIELLPPHVYHDFFPLALGGKVERYFQLLPVFDEQVQFGGWSEVLKRKQERFAADLGQLRAAIAA